MIDSGGNGIELVGAIEGVLGLILSSMREFS
jgi:hypothetical protein